MGVGDYPLRDESIIGVTIAGMSHMACAVELVGLFLNMLTLMVTARSAPSSPCRQRC